MIKFSFNLFSLILFLLSSVHAQLPYEFILKARSINHGSTCDVAVGNDGTIFLANESDCLFVYTYSGLVGIENKTPNIPQNHKLSQNYPNPFNPSTTIKYTIPKNTHPLIPSREGKERSDRLARHLLGGGVLVTISIYDILGRDVTTLVNKKQKACYYEVIFYNFSKKGELL